MNWALQKSGHGAIEDNQLNLLTLRGISSEVPLIPTSVGLFRTDTHWVIGSDSILVDDMLSGREGRWVDSEFGKQAVSQIDANTKAIGWGNTRMGMNMLTTMSMGLTVAWPRNSHRSPCSAKTFNGWPTIWALKPDSIYDHQGSAPT